MEGYGSELGWLGGDELMSGGVVEVRCESRRGVGVDILRWGVESGGKLT